MQCSPSFSAQQVKEVFKPVKAVAGMFITSALKRFQAVISGITGSKFYRLPPENTGHAVHHAFTVVVAVREETC